MTTYSLICAIIEVQTGKKLGNYLFSLGDRISEDFIEEGTLDNGCGRLLWDNDGMSLSVRTEAEENEDDYL